jgi:hypothetical protein
MKVVFLRRIQPITPVVRIFLICLVSNFLATAHLQTVPSLFVVVDFMKVKPEDHIKYLEVEQDIWKPMHQERIDQGIIVGWYLYAVEFSGTSDEYNYVVISLYDNAENLENPWNPEIPERIHPDMIVNEIMEKTNGSRDHVKTELYSSIATAPEIPLEIPASYMQVNYMQVKPGEQVAYEQLESEIWLPIHNESIHSGHTAGWGLWRSLFPRGAGQKYQYITLNTFSEFSTVFGLDFSVPFKNIHPEMDFTEVTEKTQQLRTIVRTELWDLIDFAIR